MQRNIKNRKSHQEMFGYMMNGLKSILLLLIISSFIFHNRAMAAMRTDTFTYTQWGNADPATLTALLGGQEIVPHTPGNSFNPNLDDPYNNNTDGTQTFEAGKIDIVPSYICDSQRAVSINISGFNVARTQVNNDFNNDNNVDPYVYGYVGAFLAYNSNNAGSTLQSTTMTQNPANNSFSYTSQNIAATFDELPVGSAFVLYTGIGSHQPYGSTSTYVSGPPPTITLTYDDSSCTKRNNTPPMINEAHKTISTNVINGAVIIDTSMLQANDADGDVLSYSIISGNNNNYFAINNGNIIANSSNIPAGVYNLTIKVSDGNGGEATASATITVTGGGILPSTGLSASVLALMLAMSISIHLFILKKKY